MNQQLFNGVKLKYSALFLIVIIGLNHSKKFLLWIYQQLRKKKIITREADGVGWWSKEKPDLIRVFV